MPLEQETLGFLIGGFSIIIGFMILFTLYLWSQNKTNTMAYVSVLSHFVLLSTALFFLTQAIKFDYTLPMASEEISLRIGVSGVIWAASMIFLVIGLFKFSSNKKAY